MECQLENLLVVTNSHYQVEWENQMTKKQIGFIWSVYWPYRLIICFISSEVTLNLILWSVTVTWNGWWNGLQKVGQTDDHLLKALVRTLLSWGTKQLQVLTRRRWYVVRCLYNFESLRRLVWGAVLRIYAPRKLNVK